jgi:hypothetical protein
MLYSDPIIPRQHVAGAAWSKCFSLFPFGQVYRSAKLNRLSNCGSLTCLCQRGNWPFCPFVFLPAHWTRIGPFQTVLLVSLSYHPSVSMPSVPTIASSSVILTSAEGSRGTMSGEARKCCYARGGYYCYFKLSPRLCNNNLVA